METEGQHTRRRDQTDDEEEGEIKLDELRKDSAQFPQQQQQQPALSDPSKLASETGGELDTKKSHSADTAAQNQLR